MGRQTGHRVEPAGTTKRYRECTELRDFGKPSNLCAREEYAIPTLFGDGNQPDDGRAQSKIAGRRPRTQHLMSLSRSIRVPDYNISQDLDRLLADRSTEIAGDAALIPEALRDWWQRYFQTHQQHFRTVLGLLHQVDRGRTLEVGAVPGHLTLLMSRLGYHLEAVDLDPDRIGEFTTAHGLSVQRLDVEREMLPFADGSFRIAVFTEVLEHLRWNPLHALEEIGRVVGPGGTLILSVPNITPRHRLRFLFGHDYQGDVVEEFKKLKWAGHMGHFRLYSREEVRRMLNHAGFDVVGFHSEPPKRRAHVLLPGLWMRFSPRLYVVARRRGTAAS